MGRNSIQKETPMKLYTIILLSIIPFFLTAQTTVEEYEYLTEEYSMQIAKSEVPEKAGYYFQDLMTMVDNSGKVRLLYKESQASVVPIATLIHINGKDKVFYICVPHDESSNIVFDKYANDLQTLFESDEMARGNYSKIMFRYPKQLQKYYDEISALENGYTTSTEPITAVPEKAKSADLVPETPESKPSATLTNVEKPKVKKPKKEQAKAPLKETIVIKEAPEKGTSNSATTGTATSKVRSALSHRKLNYKPELINETDKYGVIRVDVCVNAKGQVVSVQYNKSDSDTKDEDLVKISEQLAKKYVFEKSHLTRQCGHIIFKYQFQ